jgi:hypothetical protein
VVTAVRLLYGDRAITNVRPLVRWLNLLGQPVYGRQTPDGYPLRMRDWASPGQMAARFDVAREIAAAGPRLGAGGFDRALFDPLPPRIPAPTAAMAAWCGFSAANPPGGGIQGEQAPRGRDLPVLNDLRSFLPGGIRAGS